MSRLVLTLQPAELEIPTSFLSRLAARNGCADISDLCADLGLDLGAISNGDKRAIEDLCRLADLPQDAFAKTAVLKKAKFEYRIGREPFDRQTLDRQEIRVCPKCLLEQHELSSDLWTKVHQLPWQVPQIQSCYLHNERLLVIADQSTVAQRFDSSLAIKNAWDDIRHAGHPMIADSFDQYLSKRLRKKRRRSLCDRMTIHALWRVSEALGIALTHGKSQRRSDLDDHAKREALLAGFGLLNAGEEVLFEALTYFSQRTLKAAHFQLLPHYGELQRLLLKKPNGHDDLKLFRNLMRGYLLDTYPYAPGAVVLGHEVEQRRIHSVSSATQHLKVRRDVFEAILVENGIAERNGDGEVELNRPLTLPLVERLGSQKSRYLSKKEAAKFLGVSDGVLKELQECRILQPTTGWGHKERGGYDSVHLRQLIRDLFGGTRAFQAVPDGYQTLPNLARQKRRRVSELVQLVLSGRLSASGRLGGEFKISNLLVSKIEMSEIFSDRSRKRMAKKPRNEV
ncbi:TniQ family protein [Ruegeria sp. SCP11]|uniref:TniQ family protein n=1 Tax=Ruegeria sp. SCP11 TaxID=3141378 RepID=UPI00333ADB7A